VTEGWSYMPSWAVWADFETSCYSVAIAEEIERDPIGYIGSAGIGLFKVMNSPSALHGDARVDAADGAIDRENVWPQVDFRGRP
jgi:hypothetical protein